MSYTQSLGMAESCKTGATYLKEVKAEDSLEVI